MRSIVNVSTRKTNVIPFLDIFLFLSFFFPCSSLFFPYHHPMQKLRKFFVWLAKAITVLLTILTFLLILISLFRKDWIIIAINWIGEMIHMIGNWNYLVAFLSACIESLPIIGTAVPGMNIMILIGGFWAPGHLIPTLVCASVGAMIGNYAGYWLGKKAGKDIIEQYGDWIGMGKTEEEILHKQLEKNGFWYIVLGKFHNFTRAFIPFIAGTGGMQEKKFWIYNMIGSIIWATSVNLLGVFFIDHYEAILDNIGKIMFALFIGVF